MSHENAFRRTNTDREIRAAQERARWAEDEAASLREQIHQQQDAAANRLATRRREWQEEQDHEARAAQNWNEALRKYLAILQTEISEFSTGEFPQVVADLTTQTQVVKRARQLWQEAEQEAANEIADLERRIAEIRAGFRSTVALQLQTEFPDSDLADAILNDDPEEFLQTV